MSTGSRTLSDLPDLLTVEEARQILRVGRNQVYAAIHEGELYAVKLGRSIRVPRVALERMLTGEGTSDAA